MKYLVLGDIHNEYKSLMDAHIYAQENNLTIISVGDVVDYGPNPVEVIHLMNTLMKVDSTIAIEGNHDNKIYRYLKGNDVTVSKGMVSTVEAFKKDSTARDSFNFIYENMKSFHVIGDTHITHGAFTSTYWEGDTESKQAKRAFLYGEIDNTKPFVEWNGQSYPHRTYNWVDAIPNGKTVIVGHDRSPFEEVPAFENNINQVTVSTNNNGGTVIFTDTGAGKGGFVSGVTLDEQGKFIDVIEFK